MSDGLHLLPPNATPQERALSLAISRISDIAETSKNSPVLPNGKAPDAIRDLWSVKNCPSSLLPWLAWTFSVGSWDATWSDSQKRSVIATAVAVHRTKGTIGAVSRVLAAFGGTFQIIEWWQTTPKGTPHTFTIAVSGSQITSDMQASITSALLAVIPARCRFTISYLAGYLATMNTVTVARVWNYQRFSASLN